MILPMERFSAAALLLCREVDVLKGGGEAGITFYIMARPPGAPKPAGGDVKASGGAATAAAAEAQ